VKRQGKRKPVRAMPSSQEGGPLADFRLTLRARFRRVVATSASDTRNDALTARSIMERQRDLALQLGRLCGTFPVLLAGHAEELCTMSLDIEWANAKLAESASEIKLELENWLPLACDGVKADSGWRCPAWFVEYPITPSSPRAHMPVELLGGRLSAESTARISAAIEGKIEEGLALALASARVHVASYLSNQEKQTRDIPARAEATACAIPDILHGHDYRSIFFDNEWHRLTKAQGEIVGAIHEHHKRGIPEISRKQIMRQLKIPKSRMPDSFRGCALWGTFVAPGSTRGTVRLDWPDTPQVKS
jgi:hypothetical protein